MKARYWRIRPEYYRAFSEYWMDYPTNIGVREIYLQNEAGQDIKNSSSISYISAYTQGSSASYSLSTMVNNDISSYALFVGFYDNISPYTATQLRKLYGVYNCIKFDFGTPTDVRNVSINFDRSGPVIIEASNDNNIWYRVGFETSIGLRSVIKNYPIPAEAQPYNTNHYFWGIKCINHTADQTVNVKIKRFRLLTSAGNLCPGADSRLNTFTFYKEDDGGVYYPDGKLNNLAIENNELSYDVYGSAKIIGDPTNDSYAGARYTGYYYNVTPWHNSVVYWNNTNGRNDLTQALSPICPDSIEIKFDSSISNKPKCVSLVTCDTLWISNDAPTMYNYQPYDFLSLITIDDFTPYLDSGLLISGLSTGNIKFNGINFIPDTTKPVTSCSVPAGYYISEQLVFLTSNEDSITYYKINDGPVQTYSGPVNINNDCSLSFWSVDIAGNIEDPQTRIYVIDLNPLVVTISPRPGTYRSVVIKFKLSKPGQIFWSHRDLNVSQPYSQDLEWSEWTDFEELIEQQFTLSSSIDIIYQCISEGRTYPPVAVSYYYDPEAHTVSIFPSPITVPNEEKILVTLENNYE